MINEKDRSQLLRMAGNIACGLIGYAGEDKIPKLSAQIALETLQEVDKLIALNNAPGNAQQANQSDSQ